MSDVLFARAQMGMSLGFHILFASVGIAMPVLMLVAEWHHARTGSAESLRLAKSWAKGTAVMFAVGAVSGTVLSFELGLLFPVFMRHAGPVIGMPFSLEGFAFFTEAIFLGVFLYGRDRVGRGAHLAAGVIVALSGLASAVFVTFVNAWMNAPTGFVVRDGAFVDITPLALFENPYALHEVLHTALSAYMSTAFAVAGIHAYALLHQRESVFDKRALTFALWLAVPSALLQPVVGHFASQQVAVHQPLKLAAMEQLETSESGGLVSFMAFNRFDAEVKGLDAFPKDTHPPAFVRWAFLGMVGLGVALAGLSLWWLVRRRPSRRLLLATVACAPFAAIATELGWMVTELGRQPWAVYGVMRTEHAVTPMPGLFVPFAAFSLLYLALGVVVVLILRKHVVAARRHA